MQTARPVILLIENDDGDVFLFRRALSQLEFKGTTRVVNSVSQARNYLLGCGEFLDQRYFPCPDLIVSDMNLSGSTGNEFLEWLRNEKRFSSIPLVFLSGSFQPPDKTLAMALGAGAFFTKTGDIQVMKGHVQKMLEFLPPSDGPA